MRAAMTGHLVLTTVHTEDAISAIDRLKDLGVEPYLIGGSLRGVVSQRLVRQICPNCRHEVKPDADLLDLAGIQQTNNHFYEGKGCYMCFDSGYRGRIGVFEILTVNAHIRDEIAKGKNGTELRKIVQEDGNFTPMIENGRDLILQGVTTLQEVVDKVVTVQ